jgi:uncharacterized integral membrane protein
MLRSRLVAAVLALCVATWLLLAVASLNADYKAEVELAPMASSHAPTYVQFLSNQGVRLLSYFLPYHSNPLVWVIGVVGFCAQFTPLLAVLVAAHKPVRVLCILTAAFFAYAAAEVAFSMPSANRNGCEPCGNVGAFQVLAGILLVVVAGISRLVAHRKQGSGVPRDGG